MESHEKGDFTEAAVITELKRRGIPVSIPFSDNQRYDLVLEAMDGQMQRMQVKTGWLSDGVIQFHTKSQHTNSQGNVYKHYDGDIDGFLVYVHELEQLYLVYKDEFDSRITLRVEAPAQPDSSINWASDYAFDERWPP
jgi:hypothetical protein